MIPRIRQFKDRGIAKLLTTFPWLVHGWAKRATFKRFADIPWTPLKRNVQECRLALITTGGIHLKSQSGFNMLDPDGDPTFREIPSNVYPEDLTITHNYYDHADADKDINIIFPFERIRELRASGEIGGISHRHISFMGHIRGRHIDTLMSSTSQAAARILKDDSADIVLLTPA
jgi:D-proline reductase (dithiol) PrdB